MNIMKKFEDYFLIKKIIKEIESDNLSITENGRNVGWDKKNGYIQKFNYILNTISFKFFLLTMNDKMNIVDICNEILNNKLLNKEIEFRSKIDSSHSVIMINEELNNIIKDNIKNYFLPKYKKEQMQKKFKI